MTPVELWKPSPRGWSRTIDFPTTWNELTAAELRIISMCLTLNGTRQDLLVRLLEGRARMQGRKLPAGWDQMLNLELAAADGLPLIDNLLANNTLTKNPLPVLNGLYGPENDFGDMTVGEFEDCEVFYQQYHQTRKEEYLAQLGAVLWRPGKKRGRLLERTPYRGYKPDFGSFSESVDVPTLHLIWLWYGGCRGELMALFPHVFGSSGTTASVSQPADLSAFTRLVHSGAGPKNGTRAEVRATLLKEFLFDCQLAAEQAEDMEREMSKLK